ncbi:MAG TPA: SDR family NAD(P)-dependent oxidoreductase [Roseiflexaceae bacterium]
MQIKGSVALITGGASGLGAATARRLAAAGASVVIADLNQEAGADLEAELGGQSRFVETDVTDEDGMARAVDAAASLAGGLHILIGCAGIATSERALGKEGPLDLKRFARVTQINLVGMFNAVRLAAERMTRNEPDEGGERGVIVMTSSIAAFDGQIGQAAYAASKAGIVGMTLPLARELARFGIRVACIAPGLFETPLMAGLPESVRVTLAQQVPFPSRLGRPDEYAALAQHIVENAMINGETIRLDGAIRMPPR